MTKKYEDMDKSELIERLRGLEKIWDDFSFTGDEHSGNNSNASKDSVNIKAENLELNRIKKELEKLRDDYSMLFDYAPFGYLILNDRGVIVNANLEASNLLKFPQDNLKNLPLSSFIHPDFISDFFQRLKEIKQKKEKNICELLLNVKGKPLFCQIIIMPYVPDDKLSTFFRIALTDISSKHELEISARSKDEESSAIFNQFIAGLAIYDLNGRIKDVNKKYCEIVGRKKSELLSLTINDITHPDDISKTLEELQNISPENPQRFFEKRYVKPNKEVVWVNKGIVLVKGRTGKYNMIVGTIEDITARKAAEEALKESESRFRLMADTTPAFIWMTDAKGKIIYMNKTRLEFSGNTLDDDLNSNWRETIHPDDLPMLMKLQKENKKKNKMQFEFRLKSAEGKYRWIYDTAIPRYSANGKFSGYIGSGIDITDMKEAEEKLKNAYEREKELRLETEKGKVKLSFLAEATSILNSSLEYNITLKTLAFIITPQLADWCVIDLLTDENKIERVVVSHVDPDKVKLAHEIGQKYGPDPSEPTGLWNVIRTGKPELYKLITEDQLRATTRDEEHFKIAMDLGLESAMIVPLKLRDKVFGAITLVYARSGRYYDDEDLKFIEDLATRAALAIDNARLFRESSELNYRLEEQITQLHHEMSEKKRTRDLLEASEEKFRQLAENINSVFYIFNPESQKVEYLSPAFKNIWGMEPGELYKNPDKFYEYIHPDDLKKLDNLDSASPIPELEYRIIRPDKKERWIYSKSFPLQNDKGEIYRIVGLSEDITQRKNTEEQIKNSLKEKELLLREIHHRVKNNLQIISSLLSLQSSYIKDDQTLEIFRDSQNRVKSMALVHEKLYQMKDLAGLDLPEYVRDLTQMLRNTYRRKAGIINFRLDIDKIVLNIDMAIGLGLIINELISNVFKHAFPDDLKGEVYVSVKTEKNNSLIVKVEDNGVGFPEHINFHNTESLGLQLVNTLVEQHWGKIELQNNKGAHFKITFPELKYR